MIAVLSDIDAIKADHQELFEELQDHASYYRADRKAGDTFVAHLLSDLGCLSIAHADGMLLKRANDKGHSSWRNGGGHRRGHQHDGDFHALASPSCIKDERF